MSFPNATSLTSYSNAHNRREKYQQMGASTLKEDLKKRKLVPADFYNGSPPTSPAQDVSLSHDTPSSDSTTNASSPVLPMNDTGEVNASADDFARLFPPAPGRAQDQATSKDIPHPDDPPPSHPFNLKFKEMLDADILPPRENFENLLDEFINFSKLKVKIKDPPVPTATFTQQNVEDTKFIQALYRRNRRRAVRKVIGECTKICTEDPNLLAQHYFDNSIPDYDLSLLDNWESTAEEINI